METIIIMDATAKRADLEKKALEKKILEELEKKQMENAIQKRFETELVRVSKMIEEGENSYFELNYLMDEIHNYKDARVIREVAARMTIFLEKLGYVVNEFHEYSKSWKTRSGKFGYLFFRIPE
jgi:hypothetical protein